MEELLKEFQKEALKAVKKPGKIRRNPGGIPDAVFLETIPEEIRIEIPEGLNEGIPEEIPDRIPGNISA